MSASPQLLTFPTGRELHLEEDSGHLQEANYSRLLWSQSRPPAEKENTSNTPGQIGVLPFQLPISMIKRHIEALQTSEDVEVRPAGYAYFTALQTILAAYTVLFSEKNGRYRLPTPVIGTDDLGAILISWTAGDKYVAAKFGADPQSLSSLYFEQGENYGTEDLDEFPLMSRLKWLSGR